MSKAQDLVAGWERCCAEHGEPLALTTGQRGELEERLTFMIDAPWVPCSERMPGDHETVLAWSEYGGMRFLDHVANGDDAPCWFEWEDSPVEDDDEIPTHWRPMLSPPEAKP